MIDNQEDENNVYEVDNEEYNEFDDNNNVVELMSPAYENNKVDKFMDSDEDKAIQVAGFDYSK